MFALAFVSSAATKLEVSCSDAVLEVRLRDWVQNRRWKYSYAEDIKVARYNKEACAYVEMSLDDPPEDDAPPVRTKGLFVFRGREEKDRIFFHGTPALIHWVGTVMAEVSRVQGVMG